MRQTLRVGLGLWIFAVSGWTNLAWSENAAAATNRLITEQQALVHGLHRAWVTRVQLDAGRDQIANAASDGQYLFVLTQRGQLEAIDLVTGSSIWSVSIGNRNYLSAGPAISDQVIKRFGDRLVALVNGSTLYVIKRSTGQPVWQKSLPKPAGAAPAIGGPWVYVPLVTGGVAAYELDFDPTDVRTATLMAAVGVIAVQPTVTATSVAWGTSAGFVYGYPVGSNDIRFRFDAQQPVLAPLAYSKPRFIVAVRKQYVYAVNEQTGHLAWQFTTAGTHSQQPLVLGEMLLVVTDEGNMYQLSLQSGRANWRAPNVQRLLAASPTRLYTSDGLGNLVILRRDNGRRISTLNAGRADWWFTNTLNDRILLGSKRGMIMCLHEIGLDEPTSLGGPGEPDQPQDADSKANASGKPSAADEPDALPPEEADRDDPFSK